MISFGERIRVLRQKHQMTQKEVAAKVGLSLKAISRYENNGAEPDLETISRLAELYEVDANYLLDIQAKKKSDDYNMITGDVELLTKYHSCSRRSKKIIRAIVNLMLEEDKPYPVHNEMKQDFVNDALKEEE